MSTAVIAPEAPIVESTFRFSVPAAMAQLSFVWPGLVRRNREALRAALDQVDEEFVAAFRAAHPRADSAAIARCGIHEVVLRGLSRNEPVAYWVEGRLLGTYRAFGVQAERIESARTRD